MAMVPILHAATRTGIFLDAEHVRQAEWDSAMIPIGKKHSRMHDTVQTAGSRLDPEWVECFKGRLRRVGDASKLGACLVVVRAPRAFGGGRGRAGVGGWRLGGRLAGARVRSVRYLVSLFFVPSFSPGTSKLQARSPRHALMGSRLTRCQNPRGGIPHRTSETAFAHPEPRQSLSHHS